MIMLHFEKGENDSLSHFLVPLIVMLIFASVKVIPQYERGVVFRMGKVIQPKGSGMVVIIPLPN